MSPEKKRPAKKHFLESESGFNRLLNAVKNDIPSEETIAAIHDYNIRSGKLDQSAAFYVNFLLQTEQKSADEIAKELGIRSLDLKLLEKEMTPINERSLFQFCENFVDKHSKFGLRPLFTLLKRAIVLYEMTSGETSVKKAARKKK